MKKFLIFVLTVFGTLTIACAETAPQEPTTQAQPAPVAAQPAAPLAAPKAITSLGTRAIVAAQAVAPTGQATDQPAATPTPSETAAAPAEVSTKPAPHGTYDGKVIDASTKAPLEGVRVTVGDDVVQTKADGTFHVEGTGEKLMFRAPGYSKQELAVAELHPPLEIALTPFQVRGLYLSAYGISSKKLRDGALSTLEKNNLNTLVIDFKNDRGFIPYKVDIPLAKEIGAQNLILVKDMPDLISSLKSKNIYLIARIVVFKDDPLAAARPQWAAKLGGETFRDREHLRWVDPFQKEVWNYNIAIAKAAAEMGFDEVQFDYVRCPDRKGIVFSQPSTEDSRTQTITGFLTAAHKALVPYNVMVSADIFGYVLWNTDDTGIGQKIDHAMDAVDIVSPMLYPSGFQFGIPNYRNPVQHSYEIIYLSLKRAQERTQNSPLRFRPWLQAFRDYAFNGGDFAEDRMRLQIKASDKFGASGYLFWNPRNVYPTGKFTN